MSKYQKLGLAICLVSTTVFGAEKTNHKTYTDPEVAAKEDPDFKLQGEYEVAGIGMQVIALGNQQFHMSKLNGGLPGAGWDGTKYESRTGSPFQVEKLTVSMKKVERKSPTLGQKAPKGATIIFNGKPTDKIKGEIKDGLLWAGAKTTGKFGSFKLHLEFRTPYKPFSKFGSQDRGNSGIYIHDRYEVQVLDSFGLDFKIENMAMKPYSSNKQWCGCLYKFKLADLNMAFPPLTWQTYDIDFTAAKFKSGEKVKNARITVLHNGVKIHDDVELPKGTGAGGGRKEIPEGIIHFQGHGNPVAYRNVWILEK